jgi:hypothetical protein
VTHRLPSYDGMGLVNLVAELETQLTGTALTAGLDEPIPHSSGYVVVLFDGLGAHQIGHPLATSLRADNATTLTAGFPTTTTTSLATLVTGRAPAGHGIIGHILHLPPTADLVNTLKWISPGGKPVPFDYPSVLPSPNLWERLSRAGIEPITVQPGSFLGSPLSQVLYRGCRFEPAWTTEELAQVTADVAGPGRLVVTYYPNVDVAAHVNGQDSESYRTALRGAVQLWERLKMMLGDGVTLVATADHGHIDYAEEGKQLIRDRAYDPVLFYGDARSLYVAGPVELLDRLGEETGAESVSRRELTLWLGGEPTHPDLSARLPDRLLLAPPGKLLLPRPFDKRLIGYHGGIEPAEIEIPLLVRR